MDANLDPIVPDPPLRRKKKRPVRTPSTSPPPAPPDVEYMLEGYYADDIYIMVEDELWSTAKLFTQHLHHAEYERFKRLAASRGSNVLEALPRPVDGRTKQSGGLKMQIEAEKRAKSIRDGIKHATEEGDTSSGEEDDFMQDIHLAGLMGGEPSPSKKLSGFSKPQSNTRAAAGLAQNPRKVERKKDGVLEPKSIERSASPSTRAPKPAPEQNSSTDDDDLDRMPAVAKRRLATRPIGPMPRQHDRNDVRQTKCNDPSTMVTAPGVFDKYSRPNVKSESANNEPKTSAAANFLAKRRADREKKEREETRKAQSEIEIPTFAI